MYGYIFAIVGGIVVILIVMALFASGPFSSRNKTSKDYEKGTSYQKPQSEGADLSEPRVDPKQTAKPSKTSTARNPYE